MKIKVSDFIADFFAKKGISQVFTVVGGGAMHLNDSLGHHQNLHCVYQHHEQACAMAAEGYARIAKIPAILCVTSGPGALNALTGVAGAYQDSIPIIVLSGQVKTTLTIKSTGLNLRTNGGQEFPILSAVQDMTKFAVMVEEASKIRFYLEKAYYLATNGRMGPVWLDIPIDMQGAFIEPDNLKGFVADSKEKDDLCSEDKLYNIAEFVLEKIKVAKRPVLYAGNGIRLSGGEKEFYELVHELKIPVVTCWNSIDLITTEDGCYCGRAGTMGDRAGNFAVQNSDLLICIGARLGLYQVGYNKKTWARGAYVIANDIDINELKKNSSIIDLPICADAKKFLGLLAKFVKNMDAIYCGEWLFQCSKWKKHYHVVQNKHYRNTGLVNVYAFIDVLSHSLGDDSLTVVSNGSASVVGSAAYYISKNSRFIMNQNISSMGYGLPASIGVCVASKKRNVFCIEGDGSIMMNLQELQTVVTYNLPIKIFVINNNGYHQIRQTQSNIFAEHSKIGLGPESGDLGFPDFSKIAYAFGIPYIAIKNNSELKENISKILSEYFFCLCEVFVTTEQIFEPKSATKKLPDGKLVSPPLEDLYPFLDRNELKENMYIPLLED